MEALIWLNTDWLRSITYDYRNWLHDKNIAFATIKNLTIEEIEEIEKATYQEVQRILSLYI